MSLAVMPAIASAECTQTELKLADEKEIHFMVLTHWLKRSRTHWLKHRSKLWFDRNRILSKHI